jgi:hypothetical protein
MFQSAPASRSNSRQSLDRKLCTHDFIQVPPLIVKTAQKLACPLTVQ